MSNNILILGNGFDLACGYLTSYMSFAERGVIREVAELNGTEFWPFNEVLEEDGCEHSLYQHFREHKILNQDELGRVRWIDVEGELWKYAKSKTGQNLSVEFISRDAAAFYLLKSRIGKYIRRMHPHEWDRDKEDPNVRPFLEAMKINGNFKKIFTFNYTDVQLILQLFANYSDEESLEIVHIHGSTQDENIVLGIHDDPSIPYEYSFLRKSSQKNLYDLSAELLYADEIIIYGLSIGEIDGQYFEPFFRQMELSPDASETIPSKKKKMTILTKGRSSVESIKLNIDRMGFCTEAVNDQLELRIIDMGDLYYGSRSKAEYDWLIERLKRGV